MLKTLLRLSLAFWAVSASTACKMRNTEDHAAAKPATEDTEPVRTAFHTGCSNDEPRTIAGDEGESWEFSTEDSRDIPLKGTLKTPEPVAYPAGTYHLSVSGIPPTVAQQIEIQIQARRSATAAAKLAVQADATGFRFHLPKCVAKAWKVIFGLRQAGPTGDDPQAIRFGALEYLGPNE